MLLKKPITLETPNAVYTATEVIGQGGAARVFLATDMNATTFAVKLLNASHLNKERMKRFKNEYLFGFGNSHPNILTILDYGTVQEGGEQNPFYVMERYPHSLRSLLNAPMDANLAMEMFEGILSGVEEAHLRHIIHRDLKPENILIDAHGHPIIADFGIAHFEEEDLFTAVETKKTERLANFQYAAPEQKIRGATVDQRADIYALGLIFNELFTRAVPHGTGYQMIADQQPKYAYVDEVVEQMLRQNPDKRPMSIQDVRIALIKQHDLFVARQPFLDLGLDVSGPFTNIGTKANTIVAGSSGSIYFLVNASDNATGEAIDLTMLKSDGRPLYPVEIAIIRTSPEAADYQPGDWKNISNPAAPGTYARLVIGAGNALNRGYYFCFVKISGMQARRADNILTVN